MSQPRLVRVDWDDAVATNHWRSMYRLDGVECIEVSTVGYVIRSNADEMVLAQTIAQNGGVINTQAIPKGCIRKVRRLRSKP